MPKSEQSLVSVVIPTYNRAELITTAINSVITQTYQNWEIIVVDDNSQDNTESIVNSIKDRRIRYFRHQTNLGGSIARNTGIQMSQGRYIAFLDSDDLWLPLKLQLQLETISAQNTNPDNVVSYTKFQKSNRVFYRHLILPHRGKKKDETVADYLFLQGGEILTSTMIVSRSLATAHPFRASLPNHQDLDFTLQLEQQGADLIFVPQVLTKWHTEENSDRTSLGTNYQLSLNWIEHYRGQISERAAKGFILKEVVPKMLINDNTKPATVNLLIEGVSEKIISVNYFLFLTAKLLIPRQYQQYFKILFKKNKLTKSI